MKKYIVFIFTIFIAIPLIGQHIEGRIVNTDNMPIENAYVFNKTTGAHTHSNANGIFRINNTFVGNSLEFGLLGYENKTIILTKKSLDKEWIVTMITKVFQLEELVLRKEINALQTLSRIDLAVNPVNSSQEILRKVPGLIIGQHAGGGKAEQIFLRGFDIDHGTDIALSVDGMPVNMVSHAHGQGYSDLHFIIPETIEKINFGKGPYYANQGDFNTAGYVAFATKKSIANSSVAMSLGDFNSLRTVGMFNVLDKESQEDAYIAVEYIESDGPFESPQNFNRINLFGKYSTSLSRNNQLSITASHFNSTWDASGQIPQREVTRGAITRFGAIDDTEGGFTSRTNLNLQLQSTLADGAVLQANTFYTHYNFELFSNFTFFLEDPINGDQIKQFENRTIMGSNITHSHETSLGNVVAKFTKGFGFRYDIVEDNELSRTLNRQQTLQNIQLGTVRQTNFYGFFNSEFEVGKFKLSAAVRLDYLNFRYQDDLQASYQTLSKAAALINPKFSVLYNQQDNLQWFIKSGIGFHSNDARVILQQETDQLLPRAYGFDLGNIWKPGTKLVVNTAFWYLFSEEELVYVGDAGIIEPSGRSERYGVDFGLRYQITDGLYFDTDATFTKARSLESVGGKDFIPLAPDFTLAGGVSFTDFKGFSGGLRYRYIDDRPANEDNSIVAKGYFVSDVNLNYQYKNINFGIAIENLFDVAWNETQFATTSRLRNETAAVEEIHFTPGTPFFAKATLTYQF